MPAQARRGTSAHAELQGRQRAAWGDLRYLDGSQSGCILPVLAHCCAQTHQLWVLYKWQADCPPHHQPVFPTGKWPPVAKGRAFREKTKFYTHTIHMTTPESLRSREPLRLAGMGRLLSCLLLLPLPTQLICKEAEADELHLQAGQGRSGSSSHWMEGGGCGESCIAVLRNDCTE